MSLRKIFRRREVEKKEKRGLEELSPSLPYYPVSLTEVNEGRSRRQIISLAIKGAAFLAAWPLLKQESRAALLKNLAGDKLPESGSLSAREAARIIGRELAHTNTPHKNTAHQNVPHTNENPSTHIDETKHVDMAPQGFEHTNTETHLNQNIQTHADRAHTDNPHTDEPHTNVEHANRPGL
ncbi:MAG: hypothetical protein JHC32_02045 [Candidatus Aminicenantes bacterium]|jgi:hypothetical protein|nr:hypothetical protein [Candidatus Aminicenantes bacterium]